MIGEMKTRSEHLQWCKDRALEYIDHEDIQQAMASMFSDLGKHPETKEHLVIGLGMLLLMNGDLKSKTKAREFINGIN